MTLRRADADGFEQPPVDLLREPRRRRRGPARGVGWWLLILPAMLLLLAAAAWWLLSRPAAGFAEVRRILPADTALLVWVPSWPHLEEVWDGNGSAAFAASPAGSKLLAAVMGDEAIAVARRLLAAGLEGRAEEAFAALVPRGAGGGGWLAGCLLSEVPEAEGAFGTMAEDLLAMQSGVGLQRRPDGLVLLLPRGGQVRVAARGRWLLAGSPDLVEEAVGRVDGGDAGWQPPPAWPAGEPLLLEWLALPAGLRAIGLPWGDAAVWAGRLESGVQGGWQEAWTLTGAALPGRGEGPDLALPVDAVLAWWNLGLPLPDLLVRGFDRNLPPLLRPPLEAGQEEESLRWPSRSLGFVLPGQAGPTVVLGVGFEGDASATDLVDRVVRRTDEQAVLGEVGGAVFYEVGTGGAVPGALAVREGWAFLSNDAPRLRGVMEAGHGSLPTGALLHLHGTLAALLGAPDPTGGDHFTVDASQEGEVVVGRGEGPLPPALVAMWLSAFSERSVLPDAGIR